jgi:TPR repeat protein
MKSSFYLMISMLIFFSILSCSRFSDDKQNKEEPVSGNAPFNLTDDDKKVLSQKANRGDPDAARRLANYFYLYVNNEKQGFYWNHKAAENGHIIAQFEIGRDYAIGTQYINRNFEKARYWLQKSAHSDDKEAKKYLSFLLGDKERKELSLKAAQGDGEAAYRLYGYYYYIEREHGENENYWLKKAADNGHAAAINDMAKRLQIKK